MALTRYSGNAKYTELADKHPRVSGSFALERRLWHGRRVAVRYVASRGHDYRRTQMGLVYGTLDLDAGNDDQIAVVGKGETMLIHKRRATDVFDLTRSKR